MGTARSSPTERGFTGCPPATAHNRLDLPSAGQHPPEQRPYEPAGHPLRSGNLNLVSRASATYLRPESPVRTQKPPSVRDKEDFCPNGRWHYPVIRVRA